MGSSQPAAGRDQLLLRTVPAKGLTMRRGAEGLLTCCTPGIGVKIEGSLKSRLADSGQERDSPSARCSQIPSSTGNRRS